MTNFIIGVLSSIVATILFALGTRYLPGPARSVVLALIGRLLGIGINHVYRDEDRASADMLKDARNSKIIRVLSIRGFRLTSEGRPLTGLLGKDYLYDKMEVMLADPAGPTVAKRSKGFADTSITYPKDQMYAQDIVKSINVLIAASKVNSRISVRTHTQCESFRLFVTDDNIYLSFFPKGRSASTSPVYRISRATLLYEALLEHYLWVRDCNSRERSRPVVLT